MNHPFSLSGKKILVTGASSGIGRAIAQACSEQGAELIITGRNHERLAETACMLTGEGHRVYSADLTSAADLQELVALMPRLDGFVSVAGISHPTLLQFLEREEIEKTIETNGLSTIHLTRLLLQEKKLHKNASIVFISSINGNRCGYIGSSIYAASKAMLTGFMKCIALELAPKGIRVNSILPGMIETDLLKDGTIDEESLTMDRQKYPLKRYGKPEEVAWAAVYLLSDATVWMTGSELVIDGGYTVGK